MLESFGWKITVKHDMLFSRLDFSLSRLDNAERLFPGIQRLASLLS